MKRREPQRFEFLALNLVLTGASLSLLRDPGVANVEQAVRRVHALLSRNAHLPTVQRDLALMFGGA